MHSVVLTVAWSGCWGLLAIMRGQAPLEWPPSTFHRSVILLLSPQKTNADELGLATLATVGVAIPTLLVKTHHSILMITKTITIGNGSQGPGSWMLT